MNTISLSGNEIPYIIKHSKRAKNISLRILDRGVLQITLPKYTTIPQAINFAKKKTAWILKHTENTKKIQKELPSELQDGSVLRLFDQDLYTIKVVQTQSSRTSYEIVESDIPLTLDQFQISLPKDLVSNPSPEIKKIVQKFYRKIARDYLTELTNHYSSKMGLKFNQIRIKDTKTRWGSCSSRKNLNFNYRIMLAPKPVIEYLVIHEVCHLKHLNHSQKFWDLVVSQDPSYPRHQKWLRSHGNLLHFCL